MPKKSLIIFASYTGNTEKVALRFKKVFEKKGWDCDLFKIDRKTDFNNLPFKYSNYDFLCVGAPVMIGLPATEIISAMIRNQESAHFSQPTIEEFVMMRVKDPAFIPHPPDEPPSTHQPIGKLTPGPKKGIVFVTYGGIHLGPKEALPALNMLEVELEHLYFKGVGSFCCPGKHGNKDTPDWWHGDIRHRPSERDLQKAEIFLEEKIEEP